MKDLLIIDAIESAKVEKPTQEALKERFLPFWETAQEWKEKALSLEVTDESQTGMMQEARIARLALRSLRVEAEKTRKSMKEDSLRYGQAVQAVYNVIHNTIAPLEEHLERQENFAKYRERERQEALKAQRIEALGDAASHIAIQTLETIGQLPDDLWEAIKAKALSSQADYEEAQARQAAEEAARQAEVAKLRADNEASRQAEAEARQALANERAKAAAAENEARKAKAEAEAAEHRAKAAEAEALKEAASRVWGRMSERKDWIAALDGAGATFAEIIVILVHIKDSKGSTGSDRLDKIIENIQ